MKHQNTFKLYLSLIFEVNVQLCKVPFINNSIYLSLSNYFY